MTAKEKLLRLQEASEQLDKITLDFFNVLGSCVDGPLTDAIWNMETVAIKATAESIGVHTESLEWFIQENEWGRKKFECNWPGEAPVVIDSIDAFLKFEKTEG